MKAHCLKMKLIQLNDNLNTISQFLRHFSLISIRLAIIKVNP